MKFLFLFYFSESLILPGLFFDDILLNPNLTSRYNFREFLFNGEIENSTKTNEKQFISATPAKTLIKQIEANKKNKIFLNGFKSFLEDIKKTKETKQIQAEREIENKICCKDCTDMNCLNTCESRCNTDNMCYNSGINIYKDYCQSKCNNTKINQINTQDTQCKHICRNITAALCIKNNCIDEGCFNEDCLLAVTNC